VEVADRHAYDTPTADGLRTVTRHGPLDKRMGTSSNAVKCDTCHRQLKDCNGHFGYVKLALPAFHVGFLKKIIEILHCICKVRLLPDAARSVIVTDCFRIARASCSTKKLGDLT
jgi:DNA-directed RNA polymerase III subunit RPC1